MQREVHSNQRDNEERFSQWRRKPLDESYTLYSQTSQNGTFSRKVYDPSKYVNDPVEEHSREEARPVSSFRSRRHREVEVSRQPVFSRHENPVQMKPKPPKLPNSFAYQLKRPSRVVDNVSLHCKDFLLCLISSIMYAQSHLHATYVHTWHRFIQK